MELIKNYRYLVSKDASDSVHEIFVEQISESSYKLKWDDNRLSPWILKTIFEKAYKIVEVLGKENIYKNESSTINNPKRDLLLD